MKRLALASVGVALCTVSLAAQEVADPRLKPAVQRIERNDAAGLRRPLSADPSLVGLTGAGVLPHWHWTLLHVAMTGKGSPEIAKALLDAGAAVNVQDNEGNTPLHFSVKRINREKVPARE